MRKKEHKMHAQQLLFIILFTCTCTRTEEHGPRFLTADTSKCLVFIDNNPVDKHIGDVWTTSDDLCMKHTCEITANGVPKVTTIQEYCYYTCYNDYELVPKKGQCCGECVRKRCTFGNKTYEIDDMWKSKDECTFYECSKEHLDDDVIGAKMTSYKKSCPSIGNCPLNQIKIRDCCEYCAPKTTQIDNKNENLSDFVHPVDKYLEIMSKDTYLNHPCRRECVKGGPAMTCNYTFVVEWYETLSKACYDCPFNKTDCYRPHCIYGDGFRRSVLVVNRMMPGPSIEVCRGDKIIVDVENHLMGESTSIHWHGLHQRGTPHFDGVVQISQCPIQSHTTFRYVINADNIGTHWWHSHVGMQRADGAFGSLIIREPKINLPELIRDTYDIDSIDHVMIMQDWDHKTGTSGFNSFHHSIGHNKPKNILINAKGRFFEPNLEKEIKQTTTPLPLTSTELTATKLSSFSPNNNSNINSNNSNDNKLSKKSISVISAKQKRDITNSDVIYESHHTPFELLTVRKGLRYRFRTINSGFLNCPLEISIDNHTMLVIASDGRYFEPVMVDSLVTYAGERFDFVVDANQISGNYWIRVRGLMDCDERFLKAHQGAILHYEDAKNVEPESKLTYDFHRIGFQMNSLNRGTGFIDSVSIAELTSLDDDQPELMKEHADYKFFVYYDFYDKNFPQFNNPHLYSIQAVSKDGNKFFGPQLNHISMKMPGKPLAVAREQNDETKFCNSSSLAAKNINCRSDFCECAHIIQVPLNATVELILVDEGYKYDANHPFHLHGHDFRVIGMERIQRTGVTVEQIKKLDDAGKIRRRLIGAPIKDTITVPDGGYTVIRFLANNPGFWLLHCHIEFHVEVGMALVFKVGDYNQMAPLPKNFPTCSGYMPSDDDNDLLTYKGSNGNIFKLSIILGLINILIVYLVNS